MHSPASRLIPVIGLSLVLAVPALLFAAGRATPLYFAMGLVVAAYFAVLVVNFEAGFIILVFIRSSLDYFRQLSGSGDFNVAAAVSVLLIVLAVFYILYRRIDIFRFEETAPFLLFLGACGVSMLFSSDYMGSLSDWLRLWSVFFVYVFARRFSGSERNLRPFLLVVFLSALLPIAAAYYQLITGRGTTYSNFEAGRLAGTFQHPNAFASYLLIILIFASAQLMERNSLLPRKILLPLGALTFFAFVFTFSRGAWVAFVCVMGFMGILRYRRLLLFVPVVLVAVALSVPAVMDRVRDVIDPAYRSGQSAWEWRLEAWSEILPVALEKPFFGHGLSMVDTRMGYMAHNDYLRLLTETGFAGLGAYLWLAFLLLKKSWRDYRAARSGPVKSFQLGVLAMIAGFLVREIADNTLRNTVVLIYFWIFVALARNVPLLETQPRVPDKESPHPQ